MPTTRSEDELHPLMESRLLSSIISVLLVLSALLSMSSTTPMSNVFMSSVIFITLAKFVGKVLRVKIIPGEIMTPSGERSPFE